LESILIINGAAGQGNAEKLSQNVSYDIVYRTKCAGDAESFVYNTLCNDPNKHFIVCGGDGTLNEAVNGIMRANAGDTAVLSLVPAGTGNDFIRNFSCDGKTYKIDVIKYNDRYAINMLNMGFDCKAAKKTGYYKKFPLISGTLAYITALIDVLAHKLGEHFTITYIDENGNANTLDDDFLLCAVGNGAFCGGGFKAAPHADLSDGLLDLMAVKKIGRARFISLVGKYHDGKHIDELNDFPAKGCGDIIYYKKCREINIGGLTDICADGEIFSCTEARISLMEKAINFAILDTSRKEQ